MEVIKKNIQNLKQLLDLKIEEEKLIPIILDITKVYDKEINKLIKEIKNKNNLKINTYEQKLIRNFLLKLSDKSPYSKYFHTPINFENEKILKAIKLIKQGLNKNPEKVKGTIIARLNLENKNKDFDYLKFIEDKENNKYQMIIINTTKIDVLQLKHIISKEYNNLSNYHYLAIIANIKENWDKLAEISIFCENFKIEKNFNPFNKQKNKKIEELINFIKNNPNINYNEKIKNAIEKFYEGVSYGFQFSDLLISEDVNTKILIFQKIELDETPIPCPECHQTIIRGNSYPKLLLKSFECQNPNCPSRSKSGRGKRFDYISIKKNLLLQNENNKIEKDLIKLFRRDIFKNKEKIDEMLIKFFTWQKNKILYISADNKPNIKNFNREIIYKNFSEYNYNKDLNKKNNFDILFDEIIKYIKLSKIPYKKDFITKNIITIFGNSTNIVPHLKEKIKYIITSPPYYNAREYSQWNTLIEYLIDMIINAYTISKKMEKDGLYFYNIGDIVDQDNIYVSSNMSKRRLMLGFYTMYLFKKIGLSTINNIIWDKGEVQSKRNSSPNLFPHYVKPINCYEHIIIFSKEYNKIHLTSPLIKINPVKKINSKGINTLGHTAPYPIELTNYLLQYCNTQDNEYILDPFLGSGTTLISCCKNNKKAIGIEINEKYYELAKTRIKTNCSNKLL